MPFKKEEPPPSPFAAAAAKAAPTPAKSTNPSNTNINSSDATLAQALDVMERLVQLFGFSEDIANEAVKVVGADVTACYNYILDQGMATTAAAAAGNGGIDPMDGGGGGGIHGSASPIEACLHVSELQLQDQLISVDSLSHSLFETPCMYHQHQQLQQQLQHNNKALFTSSSSSNDNIIDDKKPPAMVVGRLKSEYGNSPTPSTGTAIASSSSCPMGDENWLCLTCGLVLCSRFIHGHGIRHFEELPTHCMAVSLADLSVYCHPCETFIQATEEPLQPLIQRLEMIKFAHDMEPTPMNMNNIPEPNAIGPATISAPAAFVPIPPYATLSDESEQSTNSTRFASLVSIESSSLQQQQTSMGGGGGGMGGFPMSQSIGGGPTLAPSGASFVTSTSSTTNSSTRVATLSDESEQSTNSTRFASLSGSDSPFPPYPPPPPPPPVRMAPRRGRSYTRRAEWNSEHESCSKRSRSCESHYSENSSDELNNLDGNNNTNNNNNNNVRHSISDMRTNTTISFTNTTVAPNNVFDISTRSAPPLNNDNNTINSMDISSRSMDTTTTTNTIANAAPISASIPLPSMIPLLETNPIISPTSPLPTSTTLPVQQQQQPSSPSARSSTGRYSVNFDTSSEEGDDDDDEYPFGALPTSLEDVAKFISSRNCKRIIVLSGAGMSVRSGIPDFRSANGLYATLDPDVLTCTEEEKDDIAEDPSVALNHDLFVRNPLPCLELNRNFLLGTHQRQWKATLAHRFVELLHHKFRGNQNNDGENMDTIDINNNNNNNSSSNNNTEDKLTRLYTQNIDGLEDQCAKLPRDKVINVHGSMDRAECVVCKAESDFDEFCDTVRRQVKDITLTDPTAPAESTPIPCKHCGRDGTMKPAITLFKSNLPRRFFELTPKDVQDVDLLLVIGTSLRVAPANMIVRRVPKTALRVVINRDPVGMPLGIKYGASAERDFFCAGEIDKTLLDLMTHLGWLEDLEPLLENDQLPEWSAELLRERLEQTRSTSVDR